MSDGLDPVWDPFYEDHDTPDPPQRARRRKTSSRIANRGKPSKRRPKGWKTGRIDLGGLATTDDWDAIRAGVLARAWLGLCELCGLRPPDDPHHRLMLSRGGPDAPGNLAALCRECHDRVHGHETWARGLGYLVPSGQDWSIRPITLYNGAVALLDANYGYEFLVWPK